MTSELRKWADENQYNAEPQPNSDPDNGVMPTVHLLHMQDDPLGVLAAQNGIYRGRVFRSLAEVTDDERKQALDDMMRTTLQSPLEAIKMHWMIEGVDRAFTHQMVRQRTANFGQESLRFAVMGDLLDSTTLPPELHGTERSYSADHAIRVSFTEVVDGREFTFASQAERNRAIWDWVIVNIDAGYHYLAEHGVAAEEARGLLPHATATRLHWQTDLRALMKVMGERLCTQAQFHWRFVAALVQQAVREYTPDFSWAKESNEYLVKDEWEDANRWQFEMLADSGIFRPVCYQTGKCMFMASADRDCTIRARVEAFAKEGVQSEHWGSDEWMTAAEDHLERINQAEWLLNSGAARRRG